MRLHLIVSLFCMCVWKRERERELTPGGEGENKITHTPLGGIMSHTQRWKDDGDSNCSCIRWLMVNLSDLRWLTSVWRKKTKNIYLNIEVECWGTERERERNSCNPNSSGDSYPALKFKKVLDTSWEALLDFSPASFSFFFLTLVFCFFFI